MLLTLLQLQSYKSISANVDTSKNLEPYIKEAQEFDLRAFLGEELYNDLAEDFEASPSLEKYADLYNGSDYTYAGRNYKNPGIVPVLAYYTYARYLANANSIATRTGIMVKKNDFSEQASEKTIARLIDQARSGAVTYQERVEWFLDRNKSDYPLWRYGYTKKRSKVRITGIGGNSTDINEIRFCQRCNRLWRACVCYNNY